jgi:hypothetical protein
MSKVKMSNLILKELDFSKKNMNRQNKLKN